MATSTTTPTPSTTKPTTATVTATAVPPNPKVRRVGQTIHLKASCVDEYKKIHAEVWPEVLESIGECGIFDYSIHLLPPIPPSENPILFATFKHTSINSTFEADMARMAANPVVQKWWKITDAMQVSRVEGSRGSVDTEKGWWLDCEEVFYAA